jgi:hypothetical protein
LKKEGLNHHWIVAGDKELMFASFHGQGAEGELQKTIIDLFFNRDDIATFIRKCLDEADRLKGELASTPNSLQ